MIHYHGTPITPRVKLLELAGRSFCVSYAAPADVAVCHEVGQTVMLDNGAYSVWKRGLAPNWVGFVEWVRPWLEHRTTWAVMPDVIDGDEEDNDRLIAWLFNHDREVFRRSAPVWHMHESLERLRRLCGGYGRVCIGSSGTYANPGNDAWNRRMDDAMTVVCGNGPAPTWLHMLRAMDQVAGGPWPLASADSTNVARNHAGNNVRATPPKSPRAMADRVDPRQTPGRWHVPTHRQDELAMEVGTDAR